MLDVRLLIYSMLIFTVWRLYFKIQFKRYWNFSISHCFSQMFITKNINNIKTIRKIHKQSTIKLIYYISKNIYCVYMQNNSIKNKISQHKSPASGQQISETQAIINIFEMQYHADIFFSKCQDSGEKPDIQKAKMFKENFMKINSKKFPNVLNLYSMRLGVNSIMKLITILENNNFTSLNLADNSISEYGMHAVKNLLSIGILEQLNLASNMISEIGLSLVLDDLIRNNKLKMLDLGITQGSIRKNSFGIDGARCIAAVLLQNKTLEILRLQDNDIGINGAQIISIPLKRNKVLKQLKIAENLIKTQGAEYILTNALYLESLDMGKNFIKSAIGPYIKKYLETNKNFKRLNLQLNELHCDGAKILFEGVVNSMIQNINIKGNVITDKGILQIANVFEMNNNIHQHLTSLDISSNQLTVESTKPLSKIFQYVHLKYLNISKNNIGDQGSQILINGLINSLAGQSIEKLDCSACKISDKGFIKVLQDINLLPQIRNLKYGDNYISEKFQKIFAQLLDHNKTLISLNLNGNRLSLSGMKGIKRIIDRNLKNYEQIEPNRMKSQIYNLKQKQKKIKEAQEKLQRQKKQIAKLEDIKTKLSENVVKMEKQEKQRRKQYDEIINKKMEEIMNLDNSHSQKVEELENAKAQKLATLEKMNKQLQSLREKRKNLQYELTVVQNQGEAIQKEFEMKVKKLK